MIILVVIIFLISLIPAGLFLLIIKKNQWKYRGVLFIIISSGYFICIFMVLNHFSGVLYD
jgi:hypothetical protein